MFFVRPYNRVSYHMLLLLYDLNGKVLRFSQGNKKVRWILIEAANTASRTDDRLRKFYLRLAKKHGRHIAITHVTNKMCTII